MRKLHQMACLVFAFGFSGTLMAGPQYYVSNSGNDNNDGRSDTTAWATIGKVNSAVTESGADVFLKSGSVFNDTQLVVDWGGSPTDTAIIGCYAMVGGVETPCDHSKARPQINGTYEPFCAASRTCAVDASGAVPSSQYVGLIRITSNHVSVNYLSIRDSAGYGISAPVQSRQANIVIENNRFDHLATSPVALGNITEVVVRNNVADMYNLCDTYKEAACSIDHVDGGARGWWAGGFSIYDSPNAQTLLENNTITRGWGEAFNCLRSTHVIMRGNLAGNVHSGSFYLDNCKHALVEHNITWGDPSGQFGGGFAAFTVGSESYGGGGEYDTSEIVIRNNLATGNSSCLNVNMFQGSVDKGKRLGFKFYGNTCVGMRRFNVDINTGTFPSTLLNSSVIKNNIFHSPTADGDAWQSGSCRGYGATDNVIWDHNFWEARPDDADCIGPNDKVGNPRLALSAAELAASDHSNQPKPEDFAIQDTSDAVGAGEDLANHLVLDPNQYPISDRFQLEGCDELDAASLTLDFHCRTRSNQPTIGALESGTTDQPRAPVVF